MDAALVELKDRLGKLTDLRRASNVLYWDMTVFMPPGGAPTRTAQLTTLEGIIHEHEVDERLGELFADLESRENGLPHDSDDASLVRVAKRDWERARRVPAELAVEFAQVSTESYEAWVKARENSDFGAFCPWLERVLDLRRRYVECFAPYDDPYDVLLEDYEPGMKTSEIRTIFATLEPELRALVAEHASEEDDDFLRGPFPIPEQDVLSRELVERFGASWDAFRLDTTVHPYEVTFGLGDVRLTSRYAEDDLLSLFTAMHECGHGLYERGVSPTLERTPLCSGVSATLHESQSRLWENLVGRSLPFWRHFFPRLRECFPDALAGYDAERWYREVNTVEPSLVRVEADEATYNLHIILRFELEQEMLSGAVPLEDLPEAWNARMQSYVGVQPPDDRLGVLQDVHWAGGHIGYFATYALGNVISVQIWERLLEDLPDLHAQFEQGEFGTLRDWLTDRLYRHGRKFTPKETLQRIVGGPIDAPIDPGPYLRYLGTKLASLA